MVMQHYRTYISNTVKTVNYFTLLKDHDYYYEFSEK